MASFTHTTELLPQKLLAIFANFEQPKTPFGTLRDLRDAMPRHWSLCFLLSPCYLQDAMPCEWSSSDLPRVLRIWESIFYSQVFFTLQSFLLALRLPWKPAVQRQG